MGFTENAIPGLAIPGSMLKSHTAGDPMKRILSLASVVAFLWSGFANGGTARPASVPRVITTDNNASCDITVSPAATLLLPYFEVDVGKPVSDANNTIFSIINTS